MLETIRSQRYLAVLKDSALSRSLGLTCASSVSYFESYSHGGNSGRIVSSLFLYLYHVSVSACPDKIGENFIYSRHRAFWQLRLVNFSVFLKIKRTRDELENTSVFFYLRSRNSLWRKSDFVGINQT
ncbi:hypothetical protein PUN28_009218 [Cardiocondyla obscurior]|uniref:Uncharacterized protein n=1 Tax=Cardiocondyla obscurior TaxID=286306 RepID=A0AAW2FTC4_9HYME